MRLHVTIWCILPSQGHLGESPFEAGSWTKSQFVAQASPWQPALRGSHVRVNVSAILIQEVSGNIYIYIYILCYLKNGNVMGSEMLRAKISLMQRLPFQFSRLIVVFVYVNAQSFLGEWWRSFLLNQYSIFPRNMFYFPFDYDRTIADNIRWPHRWFWWILSVSCTFAPKNVTFLSSNTAAKVGRYDGTV